MTKRRNPDKMRLYYILQILIIIVCHLNHILSLPITSQPLASNPEHLTWDAWQMPENSGRHPDHKAKKITPKSIFITPNFHTSTSHNCPPDHKLDSNNRCIQIVKIDEDELLANRIQALLGQTTSQAVNQVTTDEGEGGDLYDYDYEEEDGDNGPFQLNLPLTFEAVYPEEALPLKAGEDMLLPFPGPPHRTDNDSETDETGSISYISVEKITNATEEEVSEQNRTTEATTTTEYDSSTITREPERQDTDYPLPGTDSVETETSTNRDDGLLNVTDLPQNGATDNVTDVTENVTDDFAVALINNNETSILDEFQEIKVNISDPIFDPFSEVVTGEMEWINYGNETDDIVDDSFLENESFIVSNERVTTQKTDTTMESSGADIDYPLPASQSDGESSKEISVTETPVFIVTPETTTKKVENWHPGLVQAPTRVHHKINTFVTKIEDGELLLGPTNEQSTEMKEREQAIKHEKNEAYLENLDSNNRFVYHHLPSSSSSTTTTTTTTTQKPFDTSNDRILSQIKEINRIVTENRLRHPNYPTKKQQEPTRFRFPTDYHSSDFTFPKQTSDFASSQGSRFAPSYAFNTNNNPYYESSSTFVPPTTSSAAPTTKPPFWWLPPGWHVDQSGQKPTLLRFWERMPLVRDPSMMQTQQRSSSRSTRRENSRSPSENLYKQEISAQDIYKVLQNSNRDWKHTNS